MTINHYRKFEEKFYGSRESIAKRRREYIPFVSPLLTFYPKASAFDIGCGRGEWLSVLKSLGYSEFGMDLDPGMLSDCNMHGVLAKLGDAVDHLRSINDSSQVVISAFHVIEHISRQQVFDVLMQSHRALKPGGILILETPNSENLLLATQDFYLDPTHVKPIPQNALLFELEQIGFSRIKLFRLHADPFLATKSNPSLMDVFNGVSPDYTIVAQKNGPTKIMTALDLAFSYEEGVSLQELIGRFDDRIRNSEQAEIVRQKLRQTAIWRWARAGFGAVKFIHKKFEKNVSLRSLEIVQSVPPSKRTAKDSVLTELSVTQYSNYTAQAASGPYVFRSDICRVRHFQMPLYLHWCSQFGEKPRLHRKQWEFVFISQVLAERGVFGSNTSGLGFGVGKEPLPSLFAARGSRITATDLESDAAQRLGWRDSSQHASTLSDLNTRGLCDPSAFIERVNFQVVDMNAIPNHLTDFDFCWSSCALEHLGSIRNGLNFILRSLDTLRPGGFAVHTTELNLTSNDETLDNNPSCCLFRRSDIETLVKQLRAMGHQVEEPDFTSGDTDLDQHIDMPPYKDEPHIRLKIAQFDTTSIGLVIKKGVGTII